MIALLLLAALADDVTDALVEELDRGTEELALVGAPPLYHLRFVRSSLEQTSAHAAFGGLVSWNTAPRHTLSVEVRVGSPAFDSSGFGGWVNGFGVRWLPAEPTPHAASVVAWRGLDTFYKDAVEQYSRKVAQVDREPDHPGDYLLTGPVISTPPLPTAPAGTPEAVRELVVRVSGGFSEVAGLSVGEVHAGHEVGGDWVVDSEGTSVTRPHTEYSVRAVAGVVASDGQVLVDQRLWTTRSMRPQDLPSAADATQLGADLVALASAKRFTGEYVGPVLFEGRAAAELVRWLLRPQLEGTPPDQAFETFFGDFDDGRDAARVGRRVLPAGYAVVDDPGRWPNHPGTFAHDAEGTPARAVEVVTDGIVRTLLTSRVPNRRVPDGSNGHARQRYGNRSIGTVSHLTVTPSRSVSRKRLLRAAFAVASDYKLDHVVVVRQLVEPGLLARHDPSMEDAGGLLPPPLSIVRVYADGREETLRGVRFSAVDRRALRDIVAAGPMVTSDVLMSVDGRDEELAPVEGFATRISAPSVVVAELELVAETPDSDKIPLIARETPP